MIRYVPRIALLLGLACTAAGPPPPAQDEDADKRFTQRYGDRLAEVTATSDPADDVALAARLLADARSDEVPDALTAPLCEAAYDLAVGEEDGFQTAVDAMTLLAETFPDRRDGCRDNIIDAHQQRYHNSRGRDRVEAGEELVACLVRFADEKAADQQFAEAARLYRRAMPLATNLRNVNRDQLKAKLDYARTRQAFLDQAKRLKAHLAKHPDDQEARKKLVRIYVVEFDNPKAATRQLDLQSDDLTNKYILLAGMSVDSLPLPACAALGHWYRDLAAEASAQGRFLAMRRARSYYRRYLDEAGPDADDRAAAETGLAEVNDALADIAASLPTLTVVTYEQFQATWADRFPASANRAAHGRCKASSHWGDRLPEHVFRGERTGTAWSLDGPRGWFYAEWKPPPPGRYILLFARGGAEGSNSWGQASLLINGSKTHRLDEMTSGKVLIVDLGLDVPVKSLRLNIRGSAYPGLAGIEIHPDPAVTSRAGASAPGPSAAARTGG